MNVQQPHDYDDSRDQLRLELESSWQRGQDDMDDPDRNDLNAIAEIGGKHD